MGIINVTPDSFSDGGRWETADLAVAHGRQLLAQGADIVDVGGGSTYTTRLHPEEILTGEQAVPFFRDYVLDGALPSPELLRRVRV